MHRTLSIISTTIIISLIVIFLISDIQNSIEQEDNPGNWTTGASDKFSFKYPNHWEVNVSDSRFDHYEVLFSEPTTNASITVSDEAINDMYNLYKYNPEGYVDSYMTNVLSKSPEDARKIETYPKGNFSIAGIPAYSELYVGEDSRYAVLISLAFQENNERHYTIFASSPESNYDELEPIILEIIKSITPKTIQKPLNQDGEIPPKPKDAVNDQSKFPEQLKKECLRNFDENICNFLFK